MGKPRKILSMQKGNLTVLEQQRKTQQEERIIVGQEKLARPPTWLVDNVAKKEFKRLTAELKSIALVGNLDVNNIACYCNAYSLYRKTTEELAKQPLLLEKETKDGTSIFMMNPLIKIQKNYAEEMRRFAALCGLTLDSRLKLAAVQTTKQEQDLESDFGEI